jgi:hypothetical protein
MLAVAAVGAPAAYAANHHHHRPAPKKVVTATVKKTTTKSTKTAAAKVATKGVHKNTPVVVKGRHHHHHHDHGGCAYPPQGTPHVSITTNVHAHTNRNLVITGAMKVNGCGYDSFAAGLYKLVKGHHHKPDTWVQVATTTTGKDGVISFSIPVTSTEKYKIMTAAGEGLSEAWSETVVGEFRNWAKVKV